MLCDVDTPEHDCEWVSDLVNQTDSRGPTLYNLRIVLGIKGTRRCQRCRRFPDAAVGETLRSRPRRQGDELGRGLRLVS